MRYKAYNNTGQQDNSEQDSNKRDYNKFDRGEYTNKKTILD